MTRPEGRWEPDGRAKHLRAACERQLSRARRRAHRPVSAARARSAHAAVDERAGAGGAETRRPGRAASACATSPSARSKRRGASREIAAVQVELSVWNDATILSGVAEYCVAHGLRCSPTVRSADGVRRRARSIDPVLQRIAAATARRRSTSRWRGSTTSPTSIVPLPGVTRVETARRVGARPADRADRRRSALLDDAFPIGAPAAWRSPSSQRRRDTTPRSCIVMGLPGAGKTTLAERFVADGYQRLNRDEAGGTLRALTGDLDAARSPAGGSRASCSTTPMSRASRGPTVLQAAAAHGVPVRCVWLSTSIDEAQVNAASRLVSRYGRLPGRRGAGAAAQAGRRRLSADRAVPLSARARAARREPRALRRSRCVPFARRPPEGTPIAR